MILTATVCRVGVVCENKHTIILSLTTLSMSTFSPFGYHVLILVGFISLDEMIQYMTSIFKVMYATSDEAKRQMGVSPEELARVTATQCFKDADLNQDAKVSFEEFKQVMQRYWNHQGGDR